MAANGGNPTLGFSYTQNGLYGVTASHNVTDSNGINYYSNSGTAWKNLNSDAATALNNANLTGLNPAPITCSSNKGCPGIFNINNNYTDPVNNVTNDRVNYLVSDSTNGLGSDSASSTIHFDNAPNTIRFPYVQADNTAHNMYCYEPWTRR